MTTITITLPRAAVEQALEALELGYDSAKSEADQYHAAMAGFRPERHAQMDADVQQIAAAITALRAALAQQQAEQTWVCPEAPEERTYQKPGHCENCGKTLVLAQPNPPGCDHCNHPLYAATKCRVCGRVTEQAEPEPVAWRSLNEPLNYMTRCADGTVFLNSVIMPEHAVAWAYADPQQAKQQAEPNAEYERGFIDGMQKQAQSSVDRAVNRMAEQAEPVQEPVAYRHLHEDGWEYSDAPTGEDCAGCQALYTAPPKLVPLTDGVLMGVYIDFDRTADPAWSGVEYLLRLCRAVERALEEKNER